MFFEGYLAYYVVKKHLRFYIDPLAEYFRRGCRGWIPLAVSPIDFDWIVVLLENNSIKSSFIVVKNRLRASSYSSTVLKWSVNVLNRGSKQVANNLIYQYRGTRSTRAFNTHFLKSFIDEFEFAFFSISFSFLTTGWHFFLSEKNAGHTWLRVGTQPNTYPTWQVR